MDKLIKKIRTEAEKSFFGVVYISKEGKPIYSEAFGYADIGNARKNRVNTKFAIASGTKFFTALGVGTLIDAGKLTLDATIKDIFGKDFSFIHPRATVAQLLTHSSGIWDYYDEDSDIDPENYTVAIPWSQLSTPMNYMPLFEGKKCKYYPGERFSYSNGGYIFLGMIIERVAMMLYREYIKQYVFNAAGMRYSNYYAFNQLPGNTACGYKSNGETNIYNLPIRGGSDGGAYTTAGDLSNLWKAFLKNKILSENLTREFLTPHITVEDPVKYSYGLYVSQFDGGNMYYFVGGDAGVGFDSRYIPDKDLQITIISNISDGEEKIRDVIYTNLGEIDS